jgi:hypothetical protein
MAGTTLEEVWKLVRELTESQKETARKSQETDRQIQETSRQIAEVSKKIGDLGNRLGEFVEGMVRPALVRLFQARGIAVHEVYPDVSIDRGSEGLQIDLLVLNDDDAVAVEVKSKLSQADVDEHLERLSKIKRLMPRYRELRLLGAVAAMVVPPSVARYAYRNGLFVLAQSGETVRILNDERFQPRIW